MKNKKHIIPNFESEEQEAEYWDKHSPLDLVAEPEAQKVRVRGIKDRPITIRLDSNSRLALEKLATRNGLGPSTFARIVLMSSLKKGEKFAETDSTTESRDTVESSSVVVEEAKAGTRGVILKVKAKIEEALRRALENDWKTSLGLLKEAEIIVPNEYYSDVKVEIKMVWLCIQRTSIGPLIAKAEKSVSMWDYQRANELLGDISSILETAEFPLDYQDYSLRVVNIASGACGAADRWESSFGNKLDRTLIGVSVVKANVEELVEKKVESMGVRF